MSWLKRNGNNTEKLLNDQILKTETKIEEITKAIEKKTALIKQKLLEKNKPIAKMLLVQQKHLVGQIDVLTKQLYNLEAQRSALTNSELTQQNMVAMRKAARFANMKPDKIDAVMTGLADLMEDVEEGLDIATQSIMPKQNDDEELDIELENIIQTLNDEKETFFETTTENEKDIPVEDSDFPPIPEFDPTNNGSSNGETPQPKIVEQNSILSLF